MAEEITTEQAKLLATSGFWKKMNAREICQFQLFTDRLCMPWSVFRAAIEEALGRGVFTHEFDLNVEGLRREFLGETKAPTRQQIIDLLPSHVRAIVAR